MCQMRALDDIDRTLRVIAQALKLDLHTRTRFWTRFSAAV